MKDPNADLKKFITQAFAQQGHQLRNEMKIMRQEIISQIDTKLIALETKIDGKLGSLEGSLRFEFNSKIDDLRTEMRESFIAVGESFEALRRDRDQDRKDIDKLLLATNVKPSLASNKWLHWPTFKK